MSLLFVFKAASRRRKTTLASSHLTPAEHLPSTCGYSSACQQQQTFIIHFHSVCVCVFLHTHVYTCLEDTEEVPLGWHTAVAPGRLHNIEWRMRPLTISVLLCFFKIECTLTITTYSWGFFVLFCFFKMEKKILFLRMAVKTVWSLHYFHFTKKESQQVL